MTPFAIGTWRRGDPIGLGRVGHVAVGLADGRVLVAGGCVDDDPDYEPIGDVALWHPQRRTWTSGATLLSPRWLHAACATDDGGVAVFGGFRDSSMTTPIFGVERWCPSSERWERAGKVRGLVSPCRALRLGDGYVLLVGSRSDAFLWDACGGSAVPVAPPPIRSAGAAVLALADGRVLLVGGYRARHDTEADAAVWDPQRDHWSPVGRMARPRSAPTATRLCDGTVLLVGGFDYDRNCTVADVDRWDPAAGAFAAVGRLHQARAMHSASLMPNGTVLIAGGHARAEGGGGGALASVEVFAPETGESSDAPLLHVPRRSHCAVPIEDGSILLVGGKSDIGPLRPVEIWQPAPA